VYPGIEIEKGDNLRIKFDFYETASSHGFTDSADVREIAGLRLASAKVTDAIEIGI
jgi:hypothetical protein